MNQNCFKILERWTEFTGFDVNKPKTSFRLDGYSYEINKGNEKLAKIIQDYDNSGTVAVLYIKQLFDKLLLNVKMYLYDIFNNQDKKKQFEDCQNMWRALNSQDIIDIQTNFIASINNFVNQIITVKQIGEYDFTSDYEILLDSLETVIDGLDECNIDLHLKGGVFKPINHIGTSINIFDSLANCLLNIEGQNDGIYVCYIRGHGMEGYFTFMIKNNGNILSINEKVSEHYKGEHSISRTGRWAESKQFDLFPYEAVINFEHKGYKGKDSVEVIKEDNLAIFNLGSKAYLPLLLGMLLINQKYSNKEIDSPLKYVDSLVKVNVDRQIASTERSLVITNKNSQIIALHNNLNINFELDKVLKDEYGEGFNWSNEKSKEASYYKEKKYLENGHFNNLNQIMVDLYGEGFTFSNDLLLENNKHLLLPVPKDSWSKEIPHIPEPEMVGTKRKLELEAYFQVRKQLAEYLNTKINEELNNYGGIDKVKEWYLSSIKNNIKNIYEFIYQRKVNKSYHESPGNFITDNEFDVAIIEGDYPRGYCLYSNFILNNSVKISRRDSYYTCPINGKRCNTWVVFSPQNWKGIQILTNTELPKIIKGYIKNRNHDGNSNIHATDLVSHVGTPFETWGSFTMQSNNHFAFRFAIGFSKSGFNKFIKDKGVI